MLLHIRSFARCWPALALVGMASAQSITEDALLVPGGASAGDRLGSAVALSGDTALVGANTASPDGELQAGAAYVFVNDGTTWTEQAQLLADDRAPQDSFGIGVALAGETAIVGAFGSDSNTGAAYVFVRQGTAWTQQAKLVADDGTPDDRFGWSVSISGDTAVVGAPQASPVPGIAPGAVYVFVRAGTEWTQQAKLVPPGPVDQHLFGRSVAVSGDTLVVGAPWSRTSGGANAGSAYLFVRVGAEWTRQPKLVATDSSEGDSFGIGVALAGDTALVGAYFDSHAGGQQAGSAYVFVRGGSAWTQQAKLIASDAAAFDLFGFAVSISEDTAVVGAGYAGDSGAAYTYTRLGGAWIQQSKLLMDDSAPGGLVGSSVSVSGRTAVVGAVDSDRAGPFSGAAGVFALPSTFVLGFETEDDGMTPLVNGQHLDAEFGSLAMLSSSGPNAGLGVFDSTPGGPNDPSQDLDLLVGSGNVLILQTENYPPDENDVFPQPNDDEDGGVVSFSFVDGLEAQGLRLIDLDAGDDTTVIVLVDGAGRERTYTVPSNWTGDRMLGQPGEGVLDLTTLDPQPGFGSVATAVEDAGFDALALARMDVRFAGSGALDDLVVDSSRLLRAALAVRNGSGVNPVSLSAFSRPVLGQTWTAALDCVGQGASVAELRAHRFAAAGTLTPFGEVLVGGPLVQRARAVPTSSRAIFAWDLPYDPSLLGLEVHVQGQCWSTTATGPKLLYLHGMLSNALDLVLGL